MRYGVGVGREGFAWSGIATINSKQEWPDWYPPKEMFERQPEIKKYMTQLQSGPGMHGGPGNPLGARAMYLWQGNKRHSVSDPRNGRALDHRLKRFLRLHPNDQAPRLIEA